MEQVERKKQLIVKVSEEEAAIISEKMMAAGTTNFSRYARKMLIDGYIVNNDFSAIKQLSAELGSLTRSINQIARRANETRNIYEQDILDLQRDFFEVKQKISERLVKILREE